MLMRKVRRPRGEFDLRCVRYQRRKKEQAVRDVFVPVGEVLADERIVEPQRVGENHRVPVFAQRLRPGAVQRMERH